MGAHVYEESYRFITNDAQKANNHKTDVIVSD